MTRTREAANVADVASGASPRRLIVPAALFVGVLAIFIASPNHGMTDSGYALLVSDNLLRHGDLDLARYRIEKDGAPNYRLEHVGPHVHYFFPVAGSILSVPYVAVERLFGNPIVAPDGGYRLAAETAAETRLACLLMAAFTVIVYATARLLLPVGWSAALALAVAFGTPVYSTTSRTLWSDSWALVLIGLAIHLLLRAETGAGPRRLGWIATLEAWAYFVRPTNSLALAATGVWLLLIARPGRGRFFAVAAVWLAAFMGFSLVHAGTPLPSYFHDRLRPFSGESLLGTLVSPSRGLFVCVPVALLAVGAALRFRATLRVASLARLAGGVCLVHWLVIASFDKWWGGHCYGARLCSGLVPWLALLGALGLDGARRARAIGALADAPARAWAAGAGLLVALSVAVNAVGAVSPATVRWNITPTNVDLDTERLWSWRHPQGLAWHDDARPRLTD